MQVGSSMDEFDAQLDALEQELRRNIASPRRRLPGVPGRLAQAPSRYPIHSESEAARCVADRRGKSVLLARPEGIQRGRANCARGHAGRAERRADPATSCAVDSGADTHCNSQYAGRTAQSDCVRSILLRRSREASGIAAAWVNIAVTFLGGDALQRMLACATSALTVRSGDRSRTKAHQSAITCACTAQHSAACILHEYLAGHRRLRGRA